jgi:CRP/FNR family cyclic AMP-dependent transcriptional regulator
MANDLSKPSLPAFSWIGHLKEDDRELLSSYGEFFPGHPGTTVIEEGTQQTEVFVVISGKLQVHATQADGVPRLLAEVGPGETLGEISLFTPGPATATVIATEFSQLWRIADADLLQFMTDNPGAGNVLLRTLATILAQRLRQVDPQFYGLGAYGVVETADLPPAPDEFESTEATGMAESTAAAAVPAAVTAASPAPAPAATAVADKVPMKNTAAIAQDDDEDLPPPGLAPVRQRVRTGTVPLPDPDELEPL